MTLFEMEEYQRFLNLDSLCALAGVSRAKLGKLVLKELFDNAYDVGGLEDIHSIGFDGFSVQDNGPGMDLKPNS